MTIGSLLGTWQVALSKVWFVCHPGTVLPERVGQACLSGGFHQRFCGLRVRSGFLRMFWNLPPRPDGEREPPRSDLPRGPWNLPDREPPPRPEGGWNRLGKPCTLYSSLKNSRNSLLDFSRCFWKYLTSRFRFKSFPRNRITDCRSSRLSCWEN